MPVITRKIRITPVGDSDEIKRVYAYIRNGMKVQSKAMNQYISTLYLSALNDITKDDKKELHNIYSRMPNSKKESACTDDMKFPIGLGLAGNIPYVVEPMFKKNR